MELRVLASGDPLALHARLQAAHLAQVRLADGLFEHEVVDDRGKTLANGRIAGYTARAQKSLTLPGLCPASIVTLVGLEAPCQRPLAPFGSQGQVEPVEALDRCR